MFETYIEDSYLLAVKGSAAVTEKEAKRYYRASVFYAASAMESFVFFISDFLIEGNLLVPYEIALLRDKRFCLENGRFVLVDRFELHRIEDKIKFLIFKMDPDFNFASFSAWSQYITFKDFRNTIVHPTHEEDEIDVKEYHEKLRNGLRASIQIMNVLCEKILKRPLRPGLRELSL